MAHVRTCCCVAVQSLANNFSKLNAMVPPLLNVVDFAHRLLGPSPLQYISSRLNKASNHLIPEWNPYMPKVSSFVPTSQSLA